MRHRDLKFDAMLDFDYTQFHSLSNSNYVAHIHIKPISIK